MGGKSTEVSEQLLTQQQPWRTKQAGPTHGSMPVSPIQQQCNREPGPEEQVQLASLTWEPARQWGDCGFLISVHQGSPGSPPEGWTPMTKGKAPQ